MIIDASALLAILLNEEDAVDFIAAIQSAHMRRMSAANWLEAAIRIDARRSPIASDALDDFISTSGIGIAPVTEEHARLARRAYRAYGKGAGHPARLNFGDCFAYGLAKATGEKLLFKGNDFHHTDIEAA